MFNHFMLSNFRCFSSLHLRDLARVNLIAGMNNTGKTALLEALQLHNNPNDCRLPVRINQMRGIPEPGKSVLEVCSWLFHRKHAAGGLQISTWDDKGISRTLSLLLLDAAAARQQYPEAERQLREGLRPEIHDPHLPRLVLKFEQTNEAEQVSIGILGGLGLSWWSAQIPWSIPSILLSSGTPSADQDVKFFGELEAAKRQEEILPALQILEPRLQRLSLVPLAGESVIHGDLSGFPRLVPVPFMGEGLRRLLSFLLAIGNAPGGVVLIDEVENGLHYSVMKDVWLAIAKAARRAGTQVFATTHSWECIQAAHYAFKESGPYDLRYYRLDRRGEEITVKSLDERMLDAVDKSDLEVR